MKMIEKFPLPLKKVAEDLEAIGLDPMVTGSSVDYDERKVGTDVTLTLKIRIDDVFKERDTQESAFKRAMGIIE